MGIRACGRRAGRQGGADGKGKSCAIKQRVDLLEAVGGRLHHYFFAFGEYDVVLLYEAPDNASAAAPLLAAVGVGTLVASKTTVLMSMEDAMTSMRKAGAASKQYQPPGS